MLESLKTCNKCNVPKPLTDFYGDRHSPDGRRYSCKECDRARKRTEEVRAQGRTYGQSEKGNAAYRKYRKTEKGKAATARRKEKIRQSPELKARQREYSRKHYYTPKGQATLRATRSTPEWRERRKRWQRFRYHQPDRIELHRQQGRESYHRTGKEAVKRYLAIPANRKRRNETTRIVAQRRRIRILALPATFTREEWQAALLYFGNCCAYCGDPGPLEQEHFIPVASGGPYTASNIVPSCKSCNTRKKNRLPEKWCPPEVYERIVTYFSQL